MQVFLPESEPLARYPVVVANILAVALISLVATLAERTQPGGVIALSGILKGQEPEVLLAFAPFFDNLRVTQMDDWIRVDGIRRSA